MILYYDTIMGGKHKRILDKIFEKPIRSDILWSDIEKLLITLGAEISEGSSSRIKIELNDSFAVFHRPHPRKETDKGAVKSMRKFLINSGVKKDEIQRISGIC